MKTPPQERSYVVHALPQTVISLCLKVIAAIRRPRHPLVVRSYAEARFLLSELKVSAVISEQVQKHDLHAVEVPESKSSNFT